MDCVEDIGDHSGIQWNGNLAAEVLEAIEVEDEERAWFEGPPLQKHGLNNSSLSECGVLEVQSLAVAEVERDKALSSYGDVIGTDGQWRYKAAVDPGTPGAHVSHRLRSPNFVDVPEAHPQ